MRPIFFFITVVTTYGRYRAPIFKTTNLHLIRKFQNTLSSKKELAHLRQGGRVNTMKK